MEESDSRRLHDQEADRAVLGSILLKPDLMPLVVVALRPFGTGAFYNPAHQVIWKAALAVYDAGEPPDPVLVAGQMPCHGWTHEQHPIVALGQLTDKVPTTANVQHYLAVVMRSAALREGVSACRSYADGASLNGAGTLKQLGDVRNKLDVAQRNAQAVRMAAEKVSDSSEAFLKRIQQVMSGVLIMRDINTGIRGIDRIVGGFGRGNLSIVAARPGIGKTTLACNMTINQAAAGKKVLFYSFEMSREELLLRMGAIQGRYHMDTVGPGGDEAAYKRVEESMVQLGAMPIYIVESLKPMVETLEVSLREHAAAHGPPDIVVVDYLQLMYASAKTDNRNQEVSTISRRLKELAREYGAVVVALSQLRRGDNKIPQLNDLRDSGAIEQDADSVLFLYYNSHRNAHEIVLNVDVAKNRHGDTGTSQVMFLRGKQVMIDL